MQQRSSNSSRTRAGCIQTDYTARGSLLREEIWVNALNIRAEYVRDTANEWRVRRELATGRYNRHCVYFVAGIAQVHTYSTRNARAAHSRLVYETFDT